MSQQFIAVHGLAAYFTGAIDDWPALDSWDEEYLVAQAGSIPVTVDLTPTGRGDSVTKVVKSEDSQVTTPSSTGWVHACTATARTSSSEHASHDLTASSEQEAKQQEQHTVERDDSDESSSPSGANPVSSRWFITPCEVKMEVSSFFKLFRSSRSISGRHRVVPYVQVRHQPPTKTPSQSQQKHVLQSHDQQSMMHQATVYIHPAL